jgi:hypothetical protein
MKLESKVIKIDLKKNFSLPKIYIPETHCRMETASLHKQKEVVVLLGTTSHVILSDMRKTPLSRGLLIIGKSTEALEMC